MTTSSSSATVESAWRSPAMHRERPESRLESPAPFRVHACRASRSRHRARSSRSPSIGSNAGDARSGHIAWANATPVAVRPPTGKCPDATMPDRMTTRGARACSAPPTVDFGTPPRPSPHSHVVGQPTLNQAPSTMGFHTRHVNENSPEYEETSGTLEAHPHERTFPTEVALCTTGADVEFRAVATLEERVVHAVEILPKAKAGESA